MQIDDLYKEENAGVRIEFLDFELRSGEVYHGPEYCSAKNANKKTAVSLEVAKAIARLFVDLCGIGGVEGGNIYIEVKDENDPTRFHSIFVDMMSKTIYHDDCNSDFCYHVIQSLVAIYVARNRFAAFTKLFHLPKWSKENFVKMCDEFRYCLEDIEIQDWQISRVNPLKLGIDLSVSVDYMKAVFPNRSESVFQYVDWDPEAEDVDQSSKRKCVICGKPLRGRQKKYCSSCQHSPERLMVTYSAGPKGQKSAFCIKVFGNPEKELPDVLKSRIPTVERRVFLPEETRKLIETAVNLRKNINLIGEPGTGKTLTAYAIAYAAQLPLVSLSMSGGVQEDRFQGEKTLWGGNIQWNYAPASMVIRYGGILHIDEWPFAPPEVIALLHSLLDDRRTLELSLNNGEEIKAHPNTIIILSQNPSRDSRFAGYHDTNEALEDRLLPIHFDFLPEEMEVEMLAYETGYNDVRFISQLVKMANALRQMKQHRKLHKICTPRALRDVIQLVMNDIPAKTAVQTAIINRIAVDQTEADSIQQIAERYLLI